MFKVKIAFAITAIALIEILAPAKSILAKETLSTDGTRCHSPS
jgi:hypothetical protein